MQVRIHILIFLLAATLVSCQKQEKSLAGCCANPPTGGTVGNGWVSVPNIFTPNNDGVNDNLYLHGDSLRTVHSVEIHSFARDLILERHNLPAEFSYLTLWDGTDGGKVKAGLYTIHLTVEAEDGTMGEFFGKVCNYPCGLIEGERVVAPEECVYSSQYPNPDYTGYEPYPDPACFY